MVLFELARKHHAHLIVVGGQPDELYQGPKGLVHIPGRLHALRIGHETRARVGNKALRRSNLPHLEVDAVPIREVAHHLLTDGDSIIGEASVHIVVHGPFIERHGLGGASDLGRQIPCAVEERDIGVVVGRQLVDGLAVEIQSLPPLLVLLEAPSLFF